MEVKEKLHVVRVINSKLNVQGFRKLKYVDFSTSYSITGNFLRSVVSNKAFLEPVTFCPSSRLIKSTKTFIFQKPWKLQWGKFS